MPRTHYFGLPTRHLDDLGFQRDITFNRRSSNGLEQGCLNLHRVWKHQQHGDYMSTRTTSIKIDYSECGKHMSQLAASMPIYKYSVQPLMAQHSNQIRPLRDGMQREFSLRTSKYDVGTACLGKSIEFSNGGLQIRLKERACSHSCQVVVVLLLLLLSLRRSQGDHSQ